MISDQSSEHMDYNYFCLPGVGGAVYLACEMVCTVQVCLDHEQAVKQGKQMWLELLRSYRQRSTKSHCGYPYSTIV